MENFTFCIVLLPVTRCEGHNIELPDNSSISKTVRVKIAVIGTFFKGFSISFLVIFSLIDFTLVVPYWCWKFVELLESQVSSFSIFPTLKGLNKIKILKKFKAS